MIKLSEIAVSFLLMALIVGCFGSGQPNQIHFFDLGTPTPNAHIQMPSNAVEVLVGGAYSAQILVRTDSNRIVVDPEKSWISPPQIMIRQYFTEYCVVLREKTGIFPDPNVPGLILNLNLFRFEYDLSQRRAVFGAEWFLADPSITTRGGDLSTLIRRNILIYSDSQSEDEINPAKAMSEAVQKAFAEIFANVHRISK